MPAISFSCQCETIFNRIACDYREFRPHPCGALTADLVDELTTVPTIALDLEDWESLCRTIDEYFGAVRCRRDLLDHIIAVDERHLKRLLSEYIRYYHEDQVYRAGVLPGGILGAQG